MVRISKFGSASKKNQRERKVRKSGIIQMLRHTSNSLEKNVVNKEYLASWNDGEGTDHPNIKRITRRILKIVLNLTETVDNRSTSRSST